MKLIFCVLCILLFQGNVSAQTYYSNYSVFTEYNEEEVKASDTVNVEIKRVYNKYFDVSEGGYYALDENPVYYPYVNVNIYTTSDFSDWDINYPDDKYGRIIESRKVCDDDSCLTNHLEFRYKDRKYYHYMEKSKLLDKNSSLKGYIKDENDYISYYRYQTREKISIDDNIVITNTNQEITDFIECTTHYEIIGNIDYSKNGLYDIEIATDFITIPVSVNVMIIDNVKNKYELILKDKNELIDSLNRKLLNTNNLIKENDITINTLNNKLDIYNNTINTLNNKLEISNNTINTLNDELNIFSNQISIINKENEKLILAKNKEIDIINLKLVKSYEQIDKYLNENTLLSNNLIFLNLDLKTKNGIIKKQEEIIDYLNLDIGFLKQKNNNLQQMIYYKDDNLKKLELCNKSNNDLNIKLEQYKTIKNKSLFFICFIQIILFSIVLALLKIKSMKKNN